MGEIRVLSASIVCPGRPDIVLSPPFVSNRWACLFTLKEGTRAKMKFSIIVSNQPVSGLKYGYTLWKLGIPVDRSTVMLGSYGPREKPYEIELEEETLPSGFWVRGVYCARIVVTDDEGKCYMDEYYYFRIQRTWP